MNIIIAIILIICSVFLIIGFIIVNRTFNKLDHERKSRVKNFERKRIDKEKAFETGKEMKEYVLGRYTWNRTVEKYKQLFDSRNETGK